MSVTGDRLLEQKQDPQSPPGRNFHPGMGNGVYRITKGDSNFIAAIIREEHQEMCVYSVCCPKVRR